MNNNVASINPLLLNKISHVFSIDENGKITSGGKAVTGGTHDFERRRRLLSGHTIAMGRRTWEELKGVDFAQNHDVIVVSKTLDKNQGKGVHVVRHVEEVVHAHKAHGKNCLFLLGGGSAVSGLAKKAEVILMTQVMGKDSTEEDKSLGFSIDAGQWRVAVSMDVGKAPDNIEVLLRAAVTPMAKRVVKEYLADDQSHLGVVTDWILYRLLPINRILNQGKENNAAFAVVFRELWDVWLKTFKDVRAPRLNPLKLGNDVTINYLLQVYNMAGSITPAYIEEILISRLLGFTDAEPKTLDEITKLRAELTQIEKQVMSENRVMSHRYVTLLKKDKEDGI